MQRDRPVETRNFNMLLAVAAKGQLNGRLALEYGLLPTRPRPAP
jgi:hypothetical protein